MKKAYQKGTGTRYSKLCCTYTLPFDIQHGSVLHLYTTLTTTMQPCTRTGLHHMWIWKWIIPLQTKVEEGMFGNNLNDMKVWILFISFSNTYIYLTWTPIPSQTFHAAHAHSFTQSYFLPNFTFPSVLSILCHDVNLITRTLLSFLINQTTKLLATDMQLTTYI